MSANSHVKGKTAATAFAVWLQELRSARGLTQAQVEELARRRSTTKEARFTRVYLHELETGKKPPPTLPKLAALAAIYEVSLDEMLARAGRNVPAGELAYLDPAIRLVEEEAAAAKLTLSRAMKARLIEIVRRHMREQLTIVRAAQETSDERAEEP